MMNCEGSDTYKTSESHTNKNRHWRLKAPEYYKNSATLTAKKTVADSYASRRIISASCLRIDALQKGVSLPSSSDYSTMTLCGPSTKSKS